MDDAELTQAPGEGFSESVTHPTQDVGGDGLYRPVHLSRTARYTLTLPSVILSSFVRRSFVFGYTNRERRTTTNVLCTARYAFGCTASCTGRTGVPGLAPRCRLHAEGGQRESRGIEETLASEHAGGALDRGRGLAGGARDRSVAGLAIGARDRDENDDVPAVEADGRGAHAGFALLPHQEHQTR